MKYGKIVDNFIFDSSSFYAFVTLAHVYLSAMIFARSFGLSMRSMSAHSIGFEYISSDLGAYPTIELALPVITNFFVFLFSIDFCKRPLVDSI